MHDCTSKQVLLELFLKKKKKSDRQKSFVPFSALWFKSILQSHLTTNTMIKGNTGPYTCTESSLKTGQLHCTELETNDTGHPEPISQTSLLQSGHKAHISSTAPSESIFALLTLISSSFLSDTGGWLLFLPKCFKWKTTKALSFPTCNTCVINAHLELGWFDYANHELNQVVFFPSTEDKLLVIVVLCEIEYCTLKFIQRILEKKSHEQREEREGRTEEIFLFWLLNCRQQQTALGYECSALDKMNHWAEHR